MKLKRHGFILGVPYRIASFYGNKNREPDSNICPLFWTTVFGCMVILFTTIVGILLSFIMIDPILTLWFFLIGMGGNGGFWGIGITGIGIFLWCIVAIVGFIVYLVVTESGNRLAERIEGWFENRRLNKVEKEPGLLKTFYRSVKEKTCFEVKFED